ncbi:MAG TPA: serine hydrolase domain-containing protein, partial [Ferruginibacter sp.]|nr:serine hydrolase domain-containing protein [Ferruginibacter sp.]
MRIYPLLLCLFIPCKLIAQQNYSRDVLKQIEEVENNLTGWTKIEGVKPWTLAERMKQHTTRGMSIAVIKDYKVEWVKNYGWADSAEQRPVTNTTIFQSGSISKSLNAVGVLKLVQDGKLDLHTDINQYLKSWKFPYDSVSKGKKITIANLLSHSGGLSIHGFPGYERGDTIPVLSQVLNGLSPANTKAVRSEFEPSLKFQYSGGGTTISQVIVQDITGLPYDEYMWKNVLQPLGMTSSTYSQPPKKEAHLIATGYFSDGPVKSKYHVYPEQAAAGLWSNTSDLAKFVIETQLALEGRSGKVLSPSTAQLMLTPYVDEAAALGTFILQRGTVKYFTHNGQDAGFVAKYIGSMQGGNGAVIMVNYDNGAIMEEIVNS